MSQKGVKPPPPLLCFVASRGCFSLLSYFKTPPLCFASQNIGEVARSAGGVCCDKGCLGNGERFLYRRLVNDPFAPMTFR